MPLKPHRPTSLTSAFVLSCLALLLLHSAPALADDDEPGLKPGSPLASISLGGRHTSAADLEGHSGKMAMSMASAQIRIPHLTFNYEVASFTWDDKNALPFGNGHDDPWQTMHRLSLTLDHRAKINESLSWFGRLGAAAAFEKELEDSYSGFLSTGLNYAISPNWRLTGGVILNLDSLDLSGMPVLGIGWKENPGKTAGWSANLGLPFTELRYAFNENWAVRAFADVHRRTWRLADNSDVRAKGYVRIFEIDAGLALAWTPMRDLRVSLGVYEALAREVRLYDHDGRNKNTYDQDGAPGAFLQVGYSF